MIIHRPTQIKFQSRKEAKQVLGFGRYRRLALRGEFDYVDAPKEKEKAR